MSILRKPYEISIWEDVWEGGRFVEKKICIIGSDKMQDQARIFDPSFTTNVNGTKKLTFKLYKKYIDNITGAEVDNPFFKYLINERKVKLKYKDKWHDFIIKNINETSTNYLYTYQLEDALVQELSKNGFNVVLDEKIIDKDGTSNVGTAAELATKVLRETDWGVESEKVVETVEEALVYVNLTNVIAYQIFDQKTEGEEAYKDGIIPAVIPRSLSGRALAFYSSCTNQPHRFQFIYLGTDSNGNVIVPTTDDFRNITNANCQYYIDVEGQEIATGTTMTYGEPVEGYYLPTGFSLGASPYQNDTTPLSSLYRGKRYGFAQKTKYLPQIDKYVNVYSNGGKEYYGYQKVKYHSPVLIQNLISNYEFKEDSGWTGATLNNNGKKATVEAVYGHFVTKNNNGNLETVFVSALEESISGIDVTAVTDYKSYLKIVFPDESNGVVINSCLYDNRTIIENIHPGSKFALKHSYCTSTGVEIDNLNSSLSFSLGEYSYNNNGAKYQQNNNNIEFKAFSAGDYNLTTVKTNKYSKEDFRKKSQVKLCIKGPTNTTIYLKEIELFEVVYSEDGTMLTPTSQVIVTNAGEENSIADRTIDKTYYYFTSDKLNNVRNEDQLKPDYITKILTYGTYKPAYNTGAEKVRSVTAKESNYFNILQNIAETFGMWLMLDIEHSDGTDGLVEGTVKQKKVSFKHYAGGNNYAGFKYGVNLKDIQRTFESKNIVTKLIVKANNNKYAENGFCTISRANSNPTGEDCIYDFQYFHNQGLLSISDYNDYVYGANGYFTKLKEYNRNIQIYNDLLTNLSADLTQLKAEKEVAEAGLAAAQAGLEEVETNFEKLAGFSIKEKYPGNKKLEEAGDDSEKLAQFEEERVEFDKREDIIGLRRKRLEYLDNKNKYTKELNDLDGPDGKLTKANLSYLVYSAGLQTFITDKTTENKKFFSRYSRFIQEGTWISEEYVDDEKYYADALSVMYNSCYPQAAYTINVMAVDVLPGYEFYEFNVGETTFVEDKEFFGTEERVQVNITETIEALDDPTKDQIKVQTYKNQFQDLFQKITATVQQTQYSTGAYKKAVELAEASQPQKQDFFQEALSDASAMLATAGQQTVTQGIDGITVRSTNSPADAVRIVGGAILLGRQDENGQQKWVTGITSKGISANLITAGMINTGEISIMSADGPTFRWDAYGISAYDFNNEGINTNKFVRFDKYGLYGMVGKDGTSWHPNNQDDINNTAAYSLVWDGLSITPQNLLYTNNGTEEGESPHNFTVKLGRVDDFIFNKWDKNGIPKYDSADKESKKFVKVFAVGDKVSETTVNEQFVLYSDGTLVANNLKFTGTIEWAEAASPSKDIYGKESYSKPENGTSFSEFSDNSDTNWHKIYDEKNDTHYCHTDDGGTTWNGPFLIVPKSIDHREIQYCIADVGLSEVELEGLTWNETTPKGAPDDGECVWTRVRDVYIDNTWSEWFYIAGGAKGMDTYGGRIDSSRGQIFLANDTETETTLTGYIYRGAEEVDPEGNLFRYVWYKKQGETIEVIEDINTKSFTVPVSQLVGWSVYFRVCPAEGAEAYILTETEGKVLQDIDLYVLLSNELKQYAPPIDFVAYKNGTDINIKGVAYTKETITDDSIGNTYTLYKEETCVTPIVVKADQEDWCYLVGAYLFTYSGSDNKFICAGKTGEKGEPGENGVAGARTEVVHIYKRTSDKSVVLPSGQNIEDYGWSETYPTPTSDAPYIWRSTGSKITTFKDAQGTEEDSTTYFNNWTTPELWAAYSGTTGINEQNYATYLRITNFSNTDGLYYGTGADEGKLCINASFLKSGTILVGDDVNNPVFSADIGSKMVKIGGFTVGPLVNNMYQSLYYGTRGEPGGVYIVPGGDISGFMTSIAGILRNDWVLMFGDSFGVTREGSLYAEAANFSNEITFLNVDGDSALYNNQIGWRNYSAVLPNTITCTLGRVWVAGAYTTDTTTYSTTVTISGVPKEEFTIYAWFNNNGINQVKSLTIGPTTDSSITISTSGKNAPISLGINNSGNNSTGATIVYKKTWTDSVLTGGFAIGGNVVPGFSVVTGNSGIERNPFEYSLGTAELPWAGLVTAEDSVQEASDLNLKKDVLPINDAYQTFYDSLIPVSYSFKKGKSGRTHVGFGAQQVRDALLSNGLTTTDFAGYCSETTPSGEKHYLRYSEFIALNTWQIQKLKPRVQQLEEEVILLKQRILELENKI